MMIVTVIGTHIIIPKTPQTAPQNMSATITTKGLILSEFPISFGSKNFQQTPEQRQSMPKP
jgi:hypothetical protein